MLFIALSAWKDGSHTKPVQYFVIAAYQYKCERDFNTY